MAQKDGGLKVDFDTQNQPRPNAEGPNAEGQNEPVILRARDAAHAALIAAEIIEADLDLALAKRGHASLMLSGGSSPKPVYDALSLSQIDWSCVYVGLVDERWVPVDAPGSNGGFLAQVLLKNAARKTHLIPMVNDAPSAAKGAAEISAQYLRLGPPFDVTVMGMGTDGHTASWFPQSEGLEAALDMKTAQLCVPINAAGCQGAGDYPERITLTRPAILGSQKIILFIPGQAKADVFEAARTKSIFDAPVAALLEAGERLTVITSP